MQKITLEQFNELVIQAGIKPKVKTSLRFIQSTEWLSNEEWADRELLPITDRTGSNGALLINSDENYTCCHTKCALV